MNVDMTRRYAITFCHTDGGTTIAVEKSRYAAESFNAELETGYRSRIGLEAWGDNKVDNNAWGDIKVDNKVDNNVGGDTVNDTVKHPQIRTRTTPVQHPYNETQFRTTTVPIQDTSEAGCRHDNGHAGRVTLPARKRLNHRGPLSIDVSSAWYFIMICADGHAPWIADEVKIGRAVAPRPQFIELMAEKRSAA